jgi:hypothetical protein
VRKLMWAVMLVLAVVVAYYTFNTPIWHIHVMEALMAR